MRLYNDYILFEVGQLAKSHFRIKNEEYYLSPDFDPARHAMICGRVVSVPMNLSHKPIMLQKKRFGFPPYGANKIDAKNAALAPLYAHPRVSFYRLSDILPVVQEGDLVYFHYNVLLNEKNLIDERKIVNGAGKLETVYTCRCRYDNVIATVRLGNIIMVGARVLVTPVMETWDDVQIKTFYNPKLTGGVKKLKPKEKWLTIKSRPENKYLEGTVQHVGRNFKGEECQLRPGDRILYDPDCDWLVNIEGDDYFCMYQQDIIGKFAPDLAEPDF